MRILFVTSTRVGDAILSSGLLAALLEQHPAARFTIACGGAAAGLFRHLPGLDQIIVVRKQKANGHWLVLWRDTVGQRWDLVVDLRRSGLGWFLRAKERRRQPEGRAGEARVALIGRTLGLEPPPSPTLWTSQTEEKEAAELAPPGPPILALGPTANWPGKIWPPERFAALAATLTGGQGPLPGARFLVSCGSNEVALAEPMIAALPQERLIYLPGCDLLTLYALYRRARLFIGNDSGLMHLAAAAGTPTLGLFGPTRDDYYAPWGPNCAAVRTPESYQELMQRAGPDLSQVSSLMTGLEVAPVEAAAKALLERTEPTSP